MTAHNSKIVPLVAACALAIVACFALAQVAPVAPVPATPVAEEPAADGPGTMPPMAAPSPGAMPVSPLMTAGEDPVLAPDPVPAPALDDALTTEPANGDLLFIEDDEPLVGSPTTSTSAEGTELISISLDDVPLEDVVRMFQRVSGANIIATPSNLVGSVTVSLVDVEWKPALTSILDMQNLALVEKIPGSGVYSITPRQADAPEPMIVETMFLNYTTVDDVVVLLKTILAPGAVVSPFKSRNAFVLRSTSANIGEVGQVLKLIDIPGQQVCIETKFMELSDEASKQLGIRWDSLEAFNVQAGLGPFEYSRTVESSESSEDTSETWDDRTTTDTVTKYYDVDGVQYETIEEVEVIEISDEESLIVETVTPTTEITDSIDSGETLSSSIVDSFSEVITESQSAILELDSFNMVLSALKKTDGVSVISNPKLIVANGEVGAFFSVGNREPIIRKETTRGTTDSPGDKVIAELDTSINTEFIKEGYLETGIILQVRPVVKSEGLIEAEIEPSLRRKIGTKEVDDNSWPIISVKEIKTRFTLHDGQTVAIGGLTDTSDEKQTSKIPLLGDLPLLGKYLFSHTKDVKSQTETIIFVTLSLAKPEGLAGDQGIPEQAELVHRKLLENKAHRKQFENDLKKVKDAMEAESAEMEPDGNGDVPPPPQPPEGDQPPPPAEDDPALTVETPQPAPETDATEAEPPVAEEQTAAADSAAETAEPSPPDTGEQDAEPAP